MPGELGPQHRSKNRLKRLASDVARQNLGSRPILKRPVVTPPLQHHRAKPKTQSCPRTERAETQEVQRRGKRVDPPAQVVAHLGLRPLQPVSNAQFLRQVDHEAVVGEQVVVEAFHRLAADLHRGQFAAGSRRGLHQRHRMAALQQLVGQRQAGDSGTNDYGLHRLKGPKGPAFRRSVRT